MMTVAVVISLVSLPISAGLYWRMRRAAAGAAEPGGAVQRQLAELAARQQELADSAAQALDDEYERSREHLHASREMLRRLKEGAASGLEQHIARTSEHIDALSKRLEETVREATGTTLCVARRSQQAIAGRVERARACVTLLLAESKAKEARIAVMEQRLQEAEELLDEAADLVRHACSELDAHVRYRDLVDTIGRALREAAVSLRGHAEFTARKMDRLIDESSRLIEQLELDESAAGEKAGATIELPAREPAPASAA